MKKYFFVLYIIPYVLFSQITPIDSVGDRWPAMYPLSMGNYWVYLESKIHYSSQRVVGDTIIDSEKYFIIERTYDDHFAPTHFYRIDSLGMFYVIRSNIDTMAFPVMWLNVSIGDSIPSYAPGYSWVVTKIYLDENDKMNLNYEYSSQILGGSIWIQEGIGVMESGGEGAIDVLQGALIKGYLIGDTTTYSSVFKDPFYGLSTKEFQIVGNYPNPFNPSTNIVFTVLNPQDLTMVIYSIEGRIVDRIFLNSSIQPEPIIIPGMELILLETV